MNDRVQSFTLPALYQTNDYVYLLEGHHVALVVNAASKIGNTTLTDSLGRLGVEVKSIFSPEHGFNARASAGEETGNEVYGQIPVYSLYGKTKRPSKDQLLDIDLVVFDLQDVGLRFYTYISTLQFVMESCAEYNIPLIVLDRPNPFINIVDGPVLKPDYESFIGMQEIPVIYGMTIGEYAKMLKGEQWFKGAQQLNLRIIEMNNYNFSSHFDYPIPPSPNLPNTSAIINYPALCFFEGTTISIGRGTKLPFQIVAHPRVKVGKGRIEPHSSESAKWPKHKEQSCYYREVDFQSSIDSGILDLDLLFHLSKQFKEAGEVFIDRAKHFDLITGNSELREILIQGKIPYSEYRKSWKEDIDSFKLKREKYLIYPRNN